MRLAAAALVLLTVLAYIPALWAPFVYDDIPQLIRPEVTGKSPIHLTDSRFSTLVTLRATYRFFGLNPFPYHVTNLLFHLLNGALIWMLLWHFIPSLSWRLFAVGLFLLHPLQSESVIYVTARAEMLAGTGILLSLIGLTHQRRWLMVLGALLAITAKPVGFMVFPLWLLWWWHRGQLRWKPVALMVAAAGVALAAMPGMQALLPILAVEIHGFPVECYAFLSLLSQFVWPFGLTVDHDFSRISPDASGLAILALIGILAVGIHCHRRQIGFALLWILVLIIPHLLIGPQGYLAEHHFYSCMLGMVFLLTLTLQHFTSRKEIS